MVRWIRWHFPWDTGFEIRTMAVWGRARYFSVTEAPHNNEYLRVSREETFCFFEIWRPERGSSPRSLSRQHQALHQAPHPITRGVNTGPVYSGFNLVISYYHTHFQIDVTSVFFVLPWWIPRCYDVEDSGSAIKRLFLLGVYNLSF